HASIVYEDENVIAFNDINPQGPTHVLVVPKRHIASLNDLTPDEDQIVGEIVRRAAAIAKQREISAGGFRTVCNTYREAGQTVFHIHLHLIGGRTMHWPPGYPRFSRRVKRGVNDFGYACRCAIRRPGFTLLVAAANVYHPIE